MKIEGVIFDLDGTLLDSTWVWSQIDTDFLKKRGFEVPKDYSNENLVLYIYYSVEVGFSTYNNFPHTSLNLFKTIEL